MHRQIFHAPTQPSKPFWNDPNAVHCAISSFNGAKFFSLDSEILQYAAEEASLDGLWLEIGVASGRTIRFLANLFPSNTIVGFDSFEGLPEDWIRGDKNKPKGTFSQETIPIVPENVYLIKGWFKDTLSSFAEKNKNPISFVHIDCDLYSSTKEFFEVFGDRIQKGTVIVFDEYYNYPGCETHEIKAFQEFTQKNSVDFQIIAFNSMHEQVVIKIT